MNNRACCSRVFLEVLQSGCSNVWFMMNSCHIIWKRSNGVQQIPQTSAPEAGPWTAGGKNHLVCRIMKGSFKGIWRYRPETSWLQWLVAGQSWAGWGRQHDHLTHLCSLQMSGMQDWICQSPTETWKNAIFTKHDELGLGKWSVPVQLPDDLVILKAFSPGSPRVGDWLWWTFAAVLDVFHLLLRWQKLGPYDGALSTLE